MGLSVRRKLLRKKLHKLLKQQNSQCFYCGCPLIKRGTVVHKRHMFDNKTGRLVTMEGGVFYAATIDHLVPKCMGGTDNDNNLVAACMPCNNKKGAKPLSSMKTM